LLSRHHCARSPFGAACSLMKFNLEKAVNHNEHDERNEKKEVTSLQGVTQWVINENLEN
jgi:hypothetical protein